MGPKFSEENIKELYEKIDLLESGDILVLAGSIPSGMPETIYSDIMEKLEGRNIRIIVDATGNLLMNVLRFRPFLIKPNNHELGELFGVTLETRESVVEYAKKLVEMGAENVIVSMAGQGAVFVSSNGEIYLRKAPAGKLINGVGAGDSMVAGFIAGYLKNPREGSWKTAFNMGIAAGSASAFSEYLATKEEVEALYNQIIIQEEADE